MALPAAVDAVAAEAPGRLAMLLDDGSCLTYRGLAQKSSSVAQGLVALGVSRRPLLSHMQRGCDWYVLYIAAARLGVPLAAMPVEPSKGRSPELRSLRWSQLLALEPQLLIVDDEALPTEVELRRYHFRKVLDLGAQETDASVKKFVSEVSEDDVLCFCFTGGTTGRQRCVPVTHGMAWHELRRYPEALHWPGDLSSGEGARVLQPSSLYWASAVFGQLDLALALRGCAVVSEAMDVKDLAKAIRTHQVNVVGLPPSLLSLMDPSDFIETRSQGGYCHLRRLISWGEPCPPAVASRWGAAALPWRFFDVLISTEYWLSFVASEQDEKGRSLFMPVKDLEVYLKPVGETEEFGELCLHGPGVCQSLPG
ncbi:unnamed protein product, partial [Durusdinium trenchii]